MSAILQRFPALLFDFDGTLIDSAPEIGAALNALLAERGLPAVSDAQVRSFVGDGALRLVERGLGAGGITPPPDDLKAATARYLAIYETIPPDPHCIYPGVPETLAALRDAGHQLALCTNKPERASRMVLEALGLERFFEVVAGGDSAPVRKPDPGHLLWALERLGLRADEAAMVGDNGNDVASAKGAGMPVVCVTYGYPRMAVADLGADALIDRFEQLPAALARLV
ncbi:MAG TPA: phosphoglycolate phosphatase [Azospirillaceae bacterium]|nr:phosphoglycolate phosphatase [Azospirillaceae bacterium]